MKFEIISTDSGQTLGVYEADSKEAALDALARDAGYEDAAHAARVAGVADLRVFERPDA